jgi:hypothetical protein
MMLEPIRHAHVLHGRGVFSKHDFADGKYDDVNIRGLDPRLLPEYCLMVVVQSVRMPSAVLSQSQCRCSIFLALDLLFSLQIGSLYGLCASQRYMTKVASNLNWRASFPYT